MTIFYSAATRGFYDDALHPAIPEGAFPISAECHAQMLAAQANGLDIQPGGDGAPVAVERTVPHEQAMQILRSRCDALLKASDYTQLLDFTGGEEKRLEWAAYRAELRAIRETTDDPTSVVWPQEPG